MAAPYRSYIQSEADGEFPAEVGRYHLYVSYSCPYACRAFSARNLKGLEDAISISIAHPIFKKTKPEDASDDHKGWTFADPAKEATYVGANGKEYSTEGCIPDTVLNTKYVRDIYELVAPNEEGRRYTVPLLWDKKNKKIVSNESSDILRTLDTGFRKFVSSTVDLLPETLKDEIEAMNSNLVDVLASGMFKVNFAKNEDARVQELNKFFANLQKADDILAKSRYLVGTGITEADVRLFHGLIRFDVYQRAEDKLNLTQYPNIVGYLRDLYQTPALRTTVKFEHAKLLLVNLHPEVTAAGPFVDYDAEHSRATRFIE